MINCTIDAIAHTFLPMELDFFPAVKVLLRLDEPRSTDLVQK